MLDFNINMLKYHVSFYKLSSYSISCKVKTFNGYETESCFYLIEYAYAYI